MENKLFVSTLGLCMLCGAVQEGKVHCAKNLNVVSCEVHKPNPHPTNHGSSRGMPSHLSDVVGATGPASGVTGVSGVLFGPTGATGPTGSV